MGSKRRKTYIPNPKYNPVIMSKKLERLQEDLEHHKNLLLSVNKANDLHVEHLSNFVRHDMKNAIQGIDGTLYNAKKSSRIPEDIQEELDTELNLLRSSLENFSRLIPSSRNNATTLPEVLNAVDMLSRSELQKKQIVAVFDFDRQSECKINYSFQSLVQILHNLIINADTALEGMKDRKLFLRGVIDDDMCSICLYDNGAVIDPDKREVIFNYGYSTTGGSGIGLFHARSVITEMNGTIQVIDSDIPEYTKCFKIEFNPQNEDL